MRNTLIKLVILVAVANAAIVFLASTFTSANASPEAWKNQGWSKTDFTKTAIDFGEILSGGPPKDGIPSIDSPKFHPVSETKDLGKTEPVIGIALNGDARAYPLRILIWHEIVNDTVGGVPVAVTYCPLCNSAIVFKREFEGVLHDFGTTGKLRNSDLVMYDRQTESWWQQFTGEAIVGKYTGKSLKSVPARLEAFERFKARHPNGKVLIPTREGMRDYGRNPYVGYDSRTVPYPLFAGELPKDINPMARVVVFKVAGKPQAVTLELLRKHGKLTIGDVIVSWEKGQNSALDGPAIKGGRDVGNVVAQRKTENGTSDVVYDVTFAFVFRAFHPKLPIRQS
ncbi:MAG: DUF3179 domain-containing protein [Methyloligellaceae bacterium]